MSSNKYLAIEFIGSYQTIVKFLESKGWAFDAKPVAQNKLLLKISDDSSEEVKFFTDTLIDNSKEDKITSVF